MCVISKSTIQVIYQVKCLRKPIRKLFTNIFTKFAWILKFAYQLHWHITIFNFIIHQLNIKRLLSDSSQWKIIAMKYTPFIHYAMLFLPVLAAVKAKIIILALEFFVSVLQQPSFVLKYISIARQHMNHTDRKLALCRRNETKWQSPPESYISYLRTGSNKNIRNSYHNGRWTFHVVYFQQR